jgi:hypothetical protein
MFNISKCLAAAIVMLAPAAKADPAGEALSNVVALNNTEVSSLNGNLFLSWIQFDENELDFVMFLDGRKYDVVLDDGRGTSQRAAQCPKDQLFGGDPASGCKVTFDGEYLIEDNGGSIDVSLKIWNVGFQD